MGFLGRCAALRAPTTENHTIRAARVTIEGPGPMKSSPSVRPLRSARIRLATASATHSAHSDHASQEAARVLIPPTPRPCSLAPSVTTPLYSTTVSYSLRNALRGRTLLSQGELNIQR